MITAPIKIRIPAQMLEALTSLAASTGLSVETMTKVAAVAGIPKVLELLGSPEAIASLAVPEPTVSISDTTAARIQELEELLNFPEREGLAQLLLGDIIRDLKTGALDVLSGWDWIDPEGTRESLLPLLNRWRREDDPEAAPLVLRKLLGLTQEEVNA